MNILLTGATGFIGKSFINTTINHGHVIYALYRDNSKILKFKKHESIIWIKSTLENFELKKIKNFKIDILVHLASHSTNHPYDNIENCIKVNLTSSLRFINLIYEKGVRNFYIIGTGFEYGLSCNLYDKIPVNASLQPIGTYPLSKALFSMAIKEWSQDKPNITLIYARIFHVYGKGEKTSRLWPSLKSASLKDEDFTLSNPLIEIDFTNVETICEMIMDDILKYSDSNIIKYKNLGSGNVMSIYDFANYWWKKWKSKGNLILDSSNTSKESKKIVRFVPEIEK